MLEYILCIFTYLSNDTSFVSDMHAKTDVLKGKRYVIEHYSMHDKEFREFI